MSPVLSWTELGTSRMEVPHILDIPGCGLLRAGSFAKTLSLLRAVGSSHHSAGLREPGHHIVETPVPTGPPRISQPMAPRAVAPAWGMCWSPDTFGVAEGLLALCL